MSSETDLPITVAWTEDQGWTVNKGDKQWGPSQFLPDHMDKEAFTKIKDAIGETDDAKLAQVLLKARITHAAAPRIDLDWELFVDGARICALRDGTVVTGWVTLKNAETLRTSRNAKPLRDLLKTSYPNDWSTRLEDTIQNIQQAQEKERVAVKLVEEEPEPKIDPLVLSAVQEILEAESPKETERLLTHHLDNLLAGETLNKLTIFILLISGKHYDPRLKQMILLKGEAGAGKSILMSIADLFKTKNVGRFTEHALDYTDLEGYEILKLKEIGVMDEEKQGVSTLKFLSSDDQGYTVELTVKDPETGLFITVTRRIPPITVISSTTRIGIDPQYTRRNWIISPDESIEQTIKIAKWVARDEHEQAEVLLGLQKETSHDFSKKVLTELVNQIETYDVIIPFPAMLIGILDTKALRARGDYKRVLALVKFYSILMQTHLPKIPIVNSEALMPTPNIAMRAIKIAVDALTQMASDLEARTIQVLKILDNLGITEKGARIGREERIDIATHGGWAESTVLKYLNELVRRQYASDDGKKPKTFFLLFSMTTIKRKLSVISAQIESADVLMGNMWKEAQKWLNGLSANEKVDSVDFIPGMKSRYPIPEIADSLLTKNQASSDESTLDNPQYQNVRIIRRDNIPIVTIQDKHNVILEVLSQPGIGMVSESDLFAALNEQYSITQPELIQLLKNLSKEGSVFSPKDGYYKKT